jgi:hypothetical protein
MYTNAYKIIMLSIILLELIFLKLQWLQTRCWWLTPAILATWEIDGEEFSLRPARQKFHETPSPKGTEQNGIAVWLKW